MQIERSVRGYGALSLGVKILCRGALLVVVLRMAILASTATSGELRMKALAVCVGAAIWILTLNALARWRDRQRTRTLIAKTEEFLATCQVSVR